MRQITDILCDTCKEEKRDNKYLVALPVTTQKKQIQVLVCPFCDGESAIDLAYQVR